MHGLGEVGKLQCDVRHEPGEQGAAADDLGAHLRWVAVPHHVLDGLHYGLVRDHVLLVAATVQHDRALLVQVARQLGGEPALADPRFAAQRHDVPSRRVDRAGPARPQRRQLLRSTHERHAGGIERDRQQETGTIGGRVDERGRGCEIGKVGRAELVDLFCPLEPLQVDATQVAQCDPRREPVGDELGCRSGKQHLPTAREPAQPRRSAEGRAEVVAVIHLGLARVQSGAHLQVDSLGPRLVQDGALERERGVDRVGRVCERGERAVSLALGPGHAPAVRLGDVGGELVVADHHGRHHPGMGFPEVGRALHVGEDERHDAGGHAALARAREALDEVGRARRPAARIGVEGPTHDPVDSLRQLGGDAFPHDRLPWRRGCTGEREDGRRREPEHVARPVRAGSRQLGGPVGDVAVRGRRFRAADAEDQAEPATDADEHVLGPDVGVHDRWIVPVQVVEGVGDGREAFEDRAQRQAGVTALEDEAPERRALDPVHDEDVRLLVEEEAVAHGRDRGMRP